jgi:hypothetical protein
MLFFLLLLPPFVFRRPSERFVVLSKRWMPTLIYTINAINAKGLVGSEPTKTMDDDVHVHIILDWEGMRQTRIIDTLVPAVCACARLPKSRFGLTRSRDDGSRTDHNDAKHALEERSGDRPLSTESSPSSRRGSVWPGYFNIPNYHEPEQQQQQHQPHFRSSSWSTTTPKGFFGGYSVQSTAVTAKSARVSNLFTVRTRHVPVARCPIDTTAPCGE